MSAPFEPLHRLLETMRSAGRQTVSISAIQRLIRAIDPGDLTEAQRLNHAAKMSHWQAQVDSGIEQFRADNVASMEMFKSVLEAGKTALNTCILINSGAVVALLAFTGNIMSKPPQAGNYSAGLVGDLAWAMSIFALGVLTSAIAAGAAYCAQLIYARGTGKHHINLFHRIAIGCVVAAYASFMAGAWKTLRALVVF